MIKLSTQQELVDFLTNFKSTKTATIVSKTSLKMNKKDVATKQTPNPFSDVSKIALFEAEVNFNYEDKVNDALLLEGKAQEFEAKAPKWGEFVSKALTKKDETYYIKLMPTKSLTKTTYEKADGSRVEFSELEPFVPKASGTASANQNLDNAVPFRTFKLDSIIHFKIPGVVEYTQE
jgi:hypothetical protein